MGKVIDLSGITHKNDFGPVTGILLGDATIRQWFSVNTTSLDGIFGTNNMLRLM